MRGLLWFHSGFFWIFAESPKASQGLKGVIAIRKDVKRCGPQTMAFVHLMTYDL